MSKLYLGTDEFKADYLESKEFKATFYLNYHGLESINYIMVLSDQDGLYGAYVMTQLEVYNLIRLGNIRNIKRFIK